MDLLTSIPLGQLGPAGILTVVVILIVRGDLIPAKEVVRRLADITADRDFWRDRSLDQDKTIARLADGVETTAAVVRAIPTAPNHSTAHPTGGDENP